MAERLRTKVAVLVALATMLFAVPASATQSARAVTAESVNVGTSAADNWVASRAGISPGSQILWESDADLARDLDAIVASGATRIGLDIDWNSIQDAGPNSYWWHATDRVVLAARQRGLIVDGGLGYSPSWARPADCPANTTHCLPANVDDYARFTQASVLRYGANGANPALRGSITDWSIWNEPNNSEFALPKPDPVHYAALLKAAYVAMKAADPNATVVTGGMSPAGDAADGSEISPATWLVDLYLNGAQGYFDAVGHHPYAFPNNPLDAHPWNAFTQTADLHLIMVFFGDGAKKIWGTEAGAPTGTSAVALTDAQQAQWVHDYYEGWNTTYASFTGPLSWFSHRDSGVDRADWEQNLGLLRNDWTPKPAFTAFQQVMHAPVTAPVSFTTAWDPLGGGMASGPASSSWGPNRIDTFARGGDGMLWHQAFAGQWYGWESLGAPNPGFIGDPAAVSWSPGRIDVFVRGTDHHLWHQAYEGQWYGWEDLGGDLASSPAVASMNVGRLDIFAKASDGQLQHQFWNGGWSSWETLGGGLYSDPGAVSWGPNRIDVFARGGDDQLWHKFFGGTGWSGWEPLGGGLGSGPGVASWGPNRLDAFVVGTGGGLWHLWFDGTGWHGWEPLGGTPTADPDAISWSWGRLDVFARGGDNQLWHHAFT